MEVRRILSDDASPLTYSVDCSHKVSETPSGVRFDSRTFILFLVVFLGQRCPRTLHYSNQKSSNSFSQVLPHWWIYVYLGCPLDVDCL